MEPNITQLNALNTAINKVDKGNADVLKVLYDKLVILYEE